jgi:hypothetical protein
MIEAANALYALGVDNRNTLKVFMAPEFYFRPTTADGSGGPAYSYAEYREIKAALRELANEWGLTWSFRNWLIIPGTIMWVGTGAIGKRPPTVDNIYFNTCPYIKVGWSTQSHVLEKEQSSHIDGLPTVHHSGTPVPGAKATDEAWTMYQTVAKKKKHIIEHYGTECGVEICLEHYRSLLKDILSDAVNWSVRRPLSVYSDRKSISLQLLPAGGMGIQADKVAVKNNGYILRNDGYGDDNITDPPQVQIEEVTGYLNKNFGPNALPVTYGHKPSFAQFGAAVAVAQTIPLAGHKAVPMPVGADPNYYFPQQITLYNAVPLP